MDGEEKLAQSLIVRAGRVSPYHSLKLLWSPLLRPLRGFIRQEVVDADNGPLVYRRDKDVRRLCHRVQGALLTGRADRAHNLAEGMIAHHILQWETAEEFALSLAGLGDFVRLRGAAGILPGWDGKNLRLASALAGAVLEPGPAAANKVRELSSKARCSSAVSAQWEALMPFLQTGEEPAHFVPAERVLGSVSDHWSEHGRQHFLLLERQGRFEAQGIWERTRDPFPCSVGGDLRGNGEANGLIGFSDADEFHRWLKENGRKRRRENGIVAPAAMGDFPERLWVASTDANGHDGCPAVLPGAGTFAGRSVPILFPWSYPAMLWFQAFIRGPANRNAHYFFKTDRRDTVA